MRHLLVIAIIILFSWGGTSLAQSTSNAEKEKPKDHGTIIKEQPQPEKPKDEVRSSKGRVVLQVIFRASGTVEIVKVLEVTPKDLPKDIAADLVKKSIEAVRKIKFEPAMKDGHPVSQYAKVEYNFWNDDKDKE